MERNKIVILIALFFTIYEGQSQTKDIKGLIIANSDVENIHVINKTSQKFTTTNAKGEFTIQAKLMDTIVFSSVQYKLKAVQISERIMKVKAITIFLEELVNVLDQVTVGKVLSGDLNIDINNSDEERPIDFYDVGIPGYKGKPKTQNERRLYEADHGKYISWGFGFAINTNKILNAITGRTKKLKERVRLETNDVMMYDIKARLSHDFFITFPLDEERRIEFFFFCSEDENFQARCKNKSDIEVFEFLKEKYTEYHKK